MPHQHYAQAIKAARAKAGWTQRELAARIGVHELAVSRWERGATIPSMEHRLALAEMLDMDGALLDVPDAGTPPAWATTILDNQATILALLHRLEQDCCPLHNNQQAG